MSVDVIGSFSSPMLWCVWHQLWEFPIRLPTLLDLTLPVYVFDKIYRQEGLKTSVEVIGPRKFAS